MNHNYRIRRFSPAQRLFHLLLILSFLTQGATGLSRMYIETRWGKALAGLFGGYEFARAIHIYVGILMILGFGMHIVYMLTRINWTDLKSSLFGPDSLIPAPKDLKEFIQHVGWFFGLARLPQFDRWGYWEKFDYWAVFWGIPLLGGTGLLLAFPVEASRLIPGWSLNILFWVHRIEALLAMGHVFIIHFFIAHLRRHNFPMDRTIFEGSSEVEAARHEKPVWIARIEAGGKMKDALVPVAGVWLRAVYYTIGGLAVACGIFLLAGAMINSPRITW